MDDTAGLSSTAPGPQTSGSPAPGSETPSASAYRVLARKYRPATFDDLIGQEAMVRTVSNAFEAGRIPQAWILTGVRGVGKTTTARILARALNYELPDGSITGPTITMPTLGLHCQAIIDSRHMDVIEMDAASHNGVDDVRQINDAIRYAPVSARYKVYILDEVHMVTTQGFNALLKTLEEPPPHAKFIFATTEIRKVPVTVLSRCQRFDLRRVDTATLVAHLGGIAGKEGIPVDAEALSLIARAAEGSVRDSLSLLDQAIAHAAGPVRAEDVRQMLGLADRTRIIDLFEAVMRGDIAAALKELRDQYDIGADPAVVLSDLAEFTHFVTRVKIVPSVADDLSLAEAERLRGRSFAEKLSMRVLARTWQMLLKGVAEVEASGRPVAAAEMVLVRLAYAADLPTPDDVIRALSEGGGTGSGSSAGPSSRPANGNAGGAPSASARVEQGAFASAVSPSVPQTGAPTPRAPVASLTSVMPSAMPRAQGTAQANLQSALRPNIVPAAPQVKEGAPLIINRFEELIALAAQKRDIGIKLALERDVRLVRLEDGQLDISLESSASKTLVNDLSLKLSQWTGRRWMVVISKEQGQATVKAEKDARTAELKTGVRADPMVQALLARFPGAEIVDVRLPEETPQLATGEPDDPLLDGDEPPPVDDPAAYGADWRDDDMDFR